MDNTNLTRAEESRFKDIVFIEDLLFKTDTLNRDVGKVNSVGTKADIKFIENSVFQTNDLDDVVAQHLADTNKESQEYNYSQDNASEIKSKKIKLR